MEGSHADQYEQLRLKSGSRQHGMPPALGPGGGGAGSASHHPDGSAGTAHAVPASAPASPYHPQHSGQQSTPTTKPIRRRMRVITSCLECRRRKLKCNKNNPCENCVKFSRECIYLSSKLDEASQIRLTEIKEKVGSLERSLERDVAKFGPSKARRHQRFVVDEIEYETPEELDPWPSDVVSGDMAYDHDNAEGVEEPPDLGVKIGRMRMTHRIGGFSRPRISEELITAIDQIHGSGLQSAGMRLAEMSTDGRAREFEDPEPSYLQPSDGLMLGQTAHPPTPLSMMLPTKSISDGLMEQYFRAVHPIARCVHRPSFEAQYHAFWDGVRSNFEPRPATQAVMFAAMFSAAVSLDDKVAMQRFGFDRETLINNLKTGVESALCQASFLRSTRMEPLQALIMYLIPLCRAEVSRAITILLGAAIRVAECIGLHRDGEAFGFNPVDTHVRRLLWHQLCVLDIRTAEAHGPRPSIRREDYDTRLPPNCNEEDIQPDGPFPYPEDHWTPMVFTLIRFEINEMMRVVWTDRRKLERRQMLLAEAISKTEDFRKRMIEKYEGMLQDGDPIQRYAKLVMHLLLYRCYAMALHPYHHTANLELPHRLNNVVVMASIMVTEISIQLENDAIFGDWAWYFGAYSQHQVGLLIAMEMHLRPANRDEARMWACVDYVFNLDRNMPSDAKLMGIFEEVWRKSAVYRKFEKTRQGSTSDAGGSEQFGPGSGTGSPRTHSVGTPGQQTQPQHLGSYYQSSGPPVSIPGQTEPSVLAGQLGVGSPSGSAAHLMVQPGAHQGSPAGGWLDNIDWDAINAIFPSDPTTGEINLAGYHDPSISMDWQQWR